MNRSVPALLALAGVLTFQAVGYMDGAVPQGPPQSISEHPDMAGILAAGAPEHPGIARIVDDDALTAVMQRNCTACHNDRLSTGNFSLTGFHVAAAVEDWEKTEKVVKKLRLGMMPPPGMPRPAGDTLSVLVEVLEDRVDRAAARNPQPGSRSFQRLNRAEYESAIEQLLGLRVDAGNWLPMDAVLAGFDNMADAQTLSPQLFDAYLNAAGTISRMAVGEPDAAARSQTYVQPSEVSQHEWDRLEGAPMGTRGGIVVENYFPADGHYVFGVETRGGGSATFHDLDISINGEPVALLPLEPGVPRGPRTERVFVPAGQHRVSAAFVRRTEGPYEDLLRPHEWSMAGGGGGSYGITDVPHVSELLIEGPYETTGVSETESRKRIFTCRPGAEVSERACAESIIDRLANQAFRGPVAGSDRDRLMSFYEEGARTGGFENGVRFALQGILASPHFLFRIEREPEGVRKGEVFRLADEDLASRLSFFLWNTAPDDELRSLALQGRLSDPQVFEEQTLRLLADPRSEALGSRFANQWLRLENMYEVRPDAFLYPNFSENLRRDMKRETESFFNHLVADDRSAMELFTADYSVLNERLARHYGIPGVVGESFRVTPYPADMNRRGLLGHGSILMLTSMGNRTSPVLRGVWFMEVLLGSPPPPPPPDVPMLDQTESVEDGRLLNTRERFAVHRANPACSSCHNMIDPIGVALDNYDVLGRWRTREGGVAVSAEDVLWDGTEVSGPADVARSLTSRPIPLMRNLVEFMMAYAVGRPMEHYDQPAIREVVREAEESDYSMSSLILGVVRSVPFQMKVAEGAETDASGRN